MMSSTRGGVKFVAIVRRLDGVIVASYAHKPEGGDAKTGEALVNQVITSPGTAQYSRLTVTVPSGAFHYDTSACFSYCCVAGANYPQRLAFKCLTELMRKLSESTAGGARFIDAAHKADVGGLSRWTREVCTELCSRYADAASVDKATAALNQVDEVRGIVSDSIGQILATHENLEVLEDKTETLASQSQGFQRKATVLRRNMWWRNCKLKIIIAIVVISLLLYILVPVLVNVGGGGASAPSAPSGDAGHAEEDPVLGRRLERSTEGGAAAAGMLSREAASEVERRLAETAAHLRGGTAMLTVK